ncbi:DUF7344 domain-containing protein [Halomicrococcus sp. NG-SE-24]|uniref:DUF7344 domain-containing protein n=1 Tax=Halomicrococcus sp. NG-SE-24 TaxID=3436928 RepID=UPI003D98D4F0
MTGNDSQPVEDKQVTSDVLLKTLSNERRRYALYCLERYQTPIALADLADEVARLEHNAQTLTQIPGEDILQIYLDLYHCHIPKMEAANLLEYTQEQDTVQLLQDLSETKFNTIIEDCIDGDVDLINEIQPER